MAMPLPDHPLLLLLVVIVSIVSATHAVAGADDNLTKVCSGTSSPDVCVETLKSMPESSKASPRRAAELAFQYVSKEGKELSSEMDKALAKPKEPGNVACLKTTTTAEKNI